MKIKSVLALSLCTAMLISVAVKAETKPTGDVDGDGDLSITDATVIQRYVVGIPIPYSVDPSVADVDQDNLVTVMDASCIQRLLVNPDDQVEFDLSKVPSEVTVTDSNRKVNLILVPQSDINPRDITVVVNDGSIINRIDYTDTRFKESYLAEKDSDVLHGYDCAVVDDSGSELVYVYAHYKGGLRYPFQYTIYGLRKAQGRFPIQLYYKGRLISRTTVNVNIKSDYPEIESILKLVRDAENKCWTSSMTDREKMRAFAEYISKRNTYSQMMCVQGAVYTAFAARDLGMESMLLYPGGEPTQHCDRYIVTYNLYQSTAVPGGHCACLVDYGDEVLRYDVQGGMNMIREYIWE